MLPLASSTGVKALSSAHSSVAVHYSVADDLQCLYEQDLKGDCDDHDVVFLGYLTDPAYGWDQECRERFGTHPVQVCHEWNTAAHVQKHQHGRANVL
jgi:hypothetical protein